MSGGTPTCTGGSATTPTIGSGGSGSALYNMSWDDKHAYWFTEPPSEILTVLDINTGVVVMSSEVALPAEIARLAAMRANVVPGGAATALGKEIDPLAAFKRRFAAARTPPLPTRSAARHRRESTRACRP